MGNNKCFAIESESIFELEDKINEFGKTRDIFSTQIFPTKNGYECLVWFKSAEPEPITKNKNYPEIKGYGRSYGYENEEPATSKQLFFLKENKVNIPKGLSKREAFQLIKCFKENENGK